MELDEHYLFQCLARHVISKAKELKTEFGNTWEQVDGNGKRELLEKAFMEKWEKRNGEELTFKLYAYIRCELRNGTKTIPDKRD